MYVFSSGVYCESMKVNPGQKTCCMQKRMVHIGYIPCITEVYQFFLASTKVKKSIKSIWTISSWQIHRIKTQNFFRLQNSGQIFLCEIRNLHQNGFLTGQTFFFFGSNQTILYLNVFNSVVLCEQMKFNPGQEFAACKKRMVDIGYIQCITQIYLFSRRRQKKKINKCI